MSIGWPSLNATRRAADLDSVIRRGVDLLVVGGGVTGAGIALDAASRGLRVALVERGDLAHGTSRWSSKLVHGGLRYLARGELGLARDSARERAILLSSTAPHLIRALPFLIPSTAGRVAVALGRIGTGAGDLLRVGLPRGIASMPRARWVGDQRARLLVPGLRPEARGGVVFWDGQLIDDARLVLGLARTAAAYGAAILTRVLTIIGGKLTTYRAMAEQAVDLVMSDLGAVGRCRTRRLPLLGAATPARLAAVGADPWLVARYGTEAETVAAEGGPDGRERVVPDLPVTVAELRYAVRHELAMGVDDLLDRRTRIGLVPQDRAVALPIAEQVLAALNPA